MKTIEINALNKVYGKSRGIENVTFSVDEAEIFGFVGPNGAGKSTTLKLLLNFIFPSGGSAAILGKDIVKDSRAIKTFTAYVPSDVRLYGDMTSAELFERTLRFYGLRDDGSVCRLAALFDVELKKPIRQLSLGNRKKTAILSALIQQPKVILLDEPTSGLDPLIQARLFEELLRRTREGATVLLSSHNLTEIQEYCTRTAFIKAGSITNILDLKQGFKPEKILTLSGLNNAEALAGLPLTLLHQEGTQFTFSYQGEINALLRVLAGLELSDLSIQNRTLEDQFLELYEEGGDHGNL